MTTSKEVRLLRTTTLRKASLIGLLTLLTISQVTTVSVGTVNWTSTGPEGGTIHALAVVPAIPTTIVAVTFGGGTFKSTDGGGSGYW